jgi:hypothetical protein
MIITNSTTQDSLISRYPKPEEIIKKRIRFKKTTKNNLLEWKQENYKEWNKKTTQEKNIKLEKLIKKFDPTTQIKKGKKYCFYPLLNIIEIDKNNPSIISTLHEIAHNIFGNSELQACRWSIQLFQEIFPKDYKKLKWQNHMLIK